MLQFIIIVIAASTVMLQKESNLPPTPQLLMLRSRGVAKPETLHVANMYVEALLLNEGMHTGQAFHGRLRTCTAALASRPTAMPVRTRRTAFVAAVAACATSGRVYDSLDVATR